MALIDINNNLKKNYINPIIGLDLGFGMIKASSGDLNIQFPSIVGNPISNFAKPSAVASLDELLDTLSIIYNDKLYYIGKNAQLNTRNGKISLRQDKNNNDIQTKVKIMTALALMTNENQHNAEFDILTGIPVLEFYNQKDELYNMLYNNNQPFEFIMQYGTKQVSKIIKCNKIKIISQGEGAYYSYLLSQNGNIQNEKAALAAGNIAVVDIGYRTVDIVFFQNGRYLDSSDQINNGVSQIHQEILRLIMQNYNIKKELKDIDEITRNKQVFYNTNTYNIESIINQASEAYADNIIESLYTIRNGELGDLQLILITGGGANLTFEYIKEKLKNTVRVDKIDNSEFANAQGYYRYGMFLHNQQVF